MYNIHNPFRYLTDEQLYMLKRQALESSHNINMTDRYDDDEKEMHYELLGKINEELEKRREEREEY